MDQYSEGERRFMQLADSAPTLMWRADESMGCDWVNRAWLEFTGRDLEQELGFGWADALHPDDRDACVEAYKKAFSRGKPFCLTYRLRRADGAFRWILDNGRPFTDTSGHIAGCFGSCTDVDDMVKANEALSEAVKERAEAVAQRDHLLREVQHRVRNNLQLILSIIDMQARADASSRRALALVAGRVRSIAKAQALLVDPTGRAEIDLAEYVPALAQGAVAQTVVVARPDEPLLAPLSQVVPLGLMINEILAMLADEDAERPLRVAVLDGAEGARVEIETDNAAKADALLKGGAESKLIQRLSAQAGARLEKIDRQGKIIVRIVQR